MQQTTHTETTTTRGAAVSTLAVVGFLALILIGIVLAIWAARYVPIALSHLTTTSSNTTLTTVPSDTLSFEAPATVATTTTYTAPEATSTPAAPAAPAQPVQYQPIQYQTMASQYYFPGSTPVQVPVSDYGLANLTVQITDVGRMEGGDFVSDDSLSTDDDLAVKILVTNTGTASTGDWNIRTIIPTASDKTFEFDQDEPSLSPGATLPLTLRLTRGKLNSGNNQEIKVTVDADHEVNESDENDNTDTKEIDVRK